MSLASRASSISRICAAWRAAAARWGVRLSRRRRRRRSDPEGQRARLQGSDLQAALCGGDAVLRSGRDGAGPEAGPAFPAGADRLFAADASARRAGGVEGGGQQRHRLYPFHHVGPPDRRREGGVGGPDLLSTVSGGRARRGGSRHRPRQGGRLQGAVRHHRHAGGGQSRARCPQRHEGADGPQSAHQAEICAQHPGASALAGRLHGRRHDAALSPISWCRAPVPCRRWTSRRRWNRRRCPGPISNGFAKCGTAPS